MIKEGLTAFLVEKEDRKVSNRFLIARCSSNG